MNDYKRFFIVGAMRSATTYLATILDEHPEICMAKPMSPEPKFFLKEEEYSQGLKYYESKYFNKTKQVTVCGDKTTHYFEREDGLMKLKASYPDCKILIILRDPVFRALSNYNLSVDSGFESRTMEQVFLQNIPAPDYDKEVYVSPFNYLERGKYINYLEMYYKYFDKKSIKILIMEDFLGNKLEISKVFKFLGVSASFIPGSINTKINPGYRDLLNINPEIIKRLSRYYAPYNLLLENKLGINLDKWK